MKFSGRNFQKSNEFSVFSSTSSDAFVFFSVEHNLQNFYFYSMCLQKYLLHTLRIKLQNILIKFPDGRNLNIPLHFRISAM